MLKHHKLGRPMKKSFYLLVCLIIVASSASLFGQDEENSIRIVGTNVHYEADDWITYSMTRWVNSVAVGREYVYGGTSGGVIRYNLYSNNWERPWTISDGLPDNFIICAAYDEATDYVWCSTHQGVSVYRTTWKKWENLFKDEFGLFGSDDIVSFGFDGQNVWIESRDGEYFSSENQQNSFTRKTIDTIPYEKIKWFGQKELSSKKMPELFMHDGYFIDPNGIIKDFRLDDYEITCFSSDPWNSIWVGSWGLGVGKADLRIKILELLPYGLFLNNVAAFEFDDNGNIWAGGIGSYNEQSGITFWDLEEDQFSYYQARFHNDLYSDQVTSIAIDESFIWFGTEYGLLRFNPSKNEWKTFDSGLGLRDNYIFDIEADEDNVWIATLLGLCQLEKRKMTQKDFRIQDVAEKDILNMKVYDIEIMENLLWIGTEYGLYIYDNLKKTGGFEDNANGPQNDKITAVGLFEDKEVWVGMSDGVEVFDMKSESWKGVPEKRFNTSLPINYIVVDEFAAWLATNKGVLKYDKDRKRWRTFTVEDGLPSNIVNYIGLDGDYVWFGTPEGLTRFLWNSSYRID